ncbi:MAG: hypothetical protein J6P60_02190 [Lachnospiraceae bacterium]|nr:hypothetical protein [Lachnospiraceae bacterium]
MADNRPRSRQKNVTSGGGNVYRRGSGLGTGPVGSPNGYSGKNNRGGGGRRAAGGRLSLPVVILLVAAYLLFGRGDLGGSFQNATSDNGSSQHAVGSSAQDFSGASNGSYRVNTSVAEGSRPKRTIIKGDG